MITQNPASTTPINGGEKMHRRYEFEEDDKEWEWDEEEDDEEWDEEEDDEEDW